MKNVRKMVAASLLAALITLCAWLAVPIPPVGFTLQTLGVLLALGLLGGRWGSASIALYLLLGIVGLPVFSGFRGGAAALLEPTGGFLWGFLAGGLCYWALERPGMGERRSGMRTALSVHRWNQAGAGLAAQPTDRQAAASVMTNIQPLLRT